MTQVWGGGGGTHPKSYTISKHYSHAYLGFWLRYIFKFEKFHFCAFLFTLSFIKHFHWSPLNQTLANRGHYLTIVDKANSTRLNLKPRQSKVMKSMVRARVTWAVTYLFIWWVTILVNAKPMCIKYFKRWKLTKDTLPFALKFNIICHLIVHGSSWNIKLIVIWLHKCGAQNWYANNKHTSYFFIERKFQVNHHIRHAGIRTCRHKENIHRLVKQKFSSGFQIFWPN